MPTQQPAPFSLDTFLRATNRYVINVANNVAINDNSVIVVPMPQANYLSMIMVTIRGTVTIAGTVTGGTLNAWQSGLPFPFGIFKNINFANNSNNLLHNYSLWGLYKWTRFRYGKDFFSASNNFSSAGASLTGIGQKPSAPGASVTATTYNIALTMPIPICYNRSLLAGLLNLQGINTTYNLNLTSGTLAGGITATGGSNDLFTGITGTGLSCTSALTLTVDVETCSIPQSLPGGMQPPLSLALSMTESASTTAPTSGQNTIQIPNGQLYTSMIFEIYNNGAQVSPANLSNIQMSFGSNIYPVQQSMSANLGMDYWAGKGITMPDGVFGFDLGMRLGEVNRRDMYDGIDGTDVTALQVNYNLPTGFTPASPKCVIDIESLIVAGQ
jgi:hypothetical protein